MKLPRLFTPVDDPRVPRPLDAHLDSRSLKNCSLVGSVDDGGEGLNIGCGVRWYGGVNGHSGVLHINGSANVANLSKIFGGLLIISICLVWKLIVSML